MNGTPPLLSVIIPARNEEKSIEATLAAIRRARDLVGFDRVEVLLVDNLSTDRTLESARHDATVSCLVCERLKAPCARNFGAARARGDVLVFIDADTLIPEEGLRRVAQLATRFDVGLFRINGVDGGWRSRLWWFFWNQVRRLPLPRAKALPAFMFCTRQAFARFGPFDERVVIGEEWPITAGCYRATPRRFVYDRTCAATTSNRRMDLRPFGYTRTLCKYVWAILHFSGRIHYSDGIR